MGKPEAELIPRSEEWFWHVLALALGGRTVAELKASMSLAEFERWAEFYRMHPFDDLAQIPQASRTDSA